MSRSVGIARMPYFGGERLLLVNVDLADLDLAVVFVGKLVEERRDHFARAAPFRPEIHEHGRRRTGELPCQNCPA